MMRRAQPSSATRVEVARNTPAAPSSVSEPRWASRLIAAVTPSPVAQRSPSNETPPNPRRSPAACATIAAAMSGTSELRLSASSERYVVLGAVTWFLVDATHRVEHQHGDLGSCLITRKRDARDGGPDRGAADVPRSRFIQPLRDHVIVTSLTGAKLRVLRFQLAVDLEDELFQRVFHPAIGNGARSRV